MRGNKKFIRFSVFLFFFLNTMNISLGVNFTLLTQKSTFSSFHVIVALLYHHLC